MRIFESVEAMIGHTPLVRLKALSDRSGNLVLGKVESYNPGGSVKDRIAWAMVRRAEAEGTLRRGGTIIEPTSGNTGIGVAMVAAARGYRCILVMPETASLERRMLFSAYGADLVLTPGGGGMKGAIERAEALLREVNGATILRQFDNPANPEIHELTTGPEIWNDTDGTVDAVVAGIGTGGTATGVARYLRRHKPSLAMIGVEPEESQVLQGKPAYPHKIQGIGAGFVPTILERDLLTDIVAVRFEAAVQETRRLAASEGLLVGISAGAAVVGAEVWIRRNRIANQTVVVVLPDSGERYLSTGIFQGEVSHV